MRSRRIGGAQRVRSQDALFAHVEAPEVPQQLGAIMMVEPKKDQTPVTVSDVQGLLRAIPHAGQRLHRATAWRNPAWLPQPGLRPVVIERSLEAEPDEEMALGREIDDFFGYPVDLSSGIAEACLLTGMKGGRTALLIKVHHAAADGIALITALIRRARGKPPLDHAQPSPLSAKSVARLARGVWALARAGRAPRTGLPTKVTSAARHHSLLTLPSAELRAAAREAGCGTTEFTLALISAALHEVLADAAGERIRALVPVSMRTTTTRYRHPGNHTGAACVDLPTSAMPATDRITAVRAALRRQLRSSAPAAAHTIVRAIGLLPPWAHRRLARLAYRGTWFSLITSILPGLRTPVGLNGAPILTAYPVLPLAPGVGLAIGAMHWGNKLAITITTQQDTAGLGDQLAASLEAAFAQLKKELADGTAAC